jgi:hypothetical protein
MAGHPTDGGGYVHAASDAQIADKTFPAGTDPASIAADMSQAMSADGTWRDQSQAGQLMGSPVTSEIRQVTPAASMGMGYREATTDTPR